MTTPKVIIRGRCTRKEFVEPCRQCITMLEAFGAEYRVNPADWSEPVDVVIFFQSYPHEFPKAELAQLRRANPFAPFFFVLGVCCEGMLRTAGPLDSPFYRYVHGWSGQESEQIRLFLADQPSLFSLPLTAENDEIAQWENPTMKAGSATTWSDRIDPPRNPVAPAIAYAPGFHGQPAGLRPPLLRESPKKCLILTHFGPFGNDSAMNRLLADEQERLGYTPVFSGKTLPRSFPGNIIADADDSPPEKILESIQRLRRQFADNDFTVYVDSPRFDEKNGYVQAGVTRVLPKIR